MTRINKFVALFAFALIAMVLPSIASAQYNGGYGYPGGGYGYPNGGYGNGGYNRDIRGNLDNLKNRAKDFEHQVDRGRDNYGSWGRRGTDDRRLRELADQFTDATKDLRNDYGRGRDLSGSENEARRVLDIASQIDNELYRSGVNRDAENQWNQIRYDLRVVADTYGYNGGYNNRYPNNRYPNRRSGGWGNNLPWPF
ncbi:MAG TPA: hypothetical protein VL327_07335 [Pyrinomonadaceae bacterium]|jgi:hypothetical protein|nr:hypothetical protein [Pyrinomonadaceae bacterium]